MDTEEEIFNSLIDASEEIENCEPTPKKRRQKPKVSISWTNDEILLLIQAVEEENSVWQYSSPEYKDRDIRNKSWQKISAKLFDRDVNECKAKWANIKTTFQTVKKKHFQHKSGEEARCGEPHWPFWSAMQFYSTHDAAHSTPSVSTLDFTNIDTSQTPIENSKTIEQNDSPQEAVKMAMKFLSSAEEEDHWHTIGMYVASQLRQTAKKDPSAANKLHIEIVKLTLDACAKLE